MLKLRAFGAALVGLAAAAGLITMGQLAAPPAAHALDNGQALTPPMGWNSWNQVRCYKLNEDVVKAAADNIVARGLQKVGYEYVVVDDCYQGGRDENGQLFTDAKRFPHGMKAVADYVHSKGLKFGIYAVPGSKTCANRWDNYAVTGLGSLGHEEQDIRTFASWGVDYLKYDWCDANVNDHLQEKPTFEQMRDIIHRVAPNMVYGISEYGVEKPWTWAQPVANLWRTTHDIRPNWPSILGIINSQAPLAGTSGPGGWNDPDMLQIGNGNLTHNENRSHFAMWSMLAAPLFMGTDIGKLPQDTVNIVTNPRIIAIDQDAKGVQARRVSNAGGMQVWTRPLANGDIAVAVMNTTAATRQTAVDMSSVTDQAGPWVATDQWSGQGVQNVHASLPVSVAAHDTAVFRLHPGTDPALPGAVYVDGKQQLQRGATDTVRVRVHNAGSAPLGHLTVTLGEQQLFAEAPAPQQVEGVAPGRYALVAFPVKVKPDASLGTTTVPVTVTGAGDQPVTGVDRVTVTPAPPTADTYLSDMNFLDYHGGWQNIVRRDKSQDNKPLTNNGRVYDKGVGMNSNGFVSVYLGGQCTNLDGALGVDDDTNGGNPKWGAPSIGGSIVATMSDGSTKTLWEANGVIKYRQKQDFVLPLAGVDSLRFNVTDGGDKIAYDHADWLNMKFTCSAKSSSVTVGTQTDQPTTTDEGTQTDPALNPDLPKVDTGTQTDTGTGTSTTDEGTQTDTGTGTSTTDEGTQTVNPPTTGKVDTGLPPVTPQVPGKDTPQQPVNPAVPGKDTPQQPANPAVPGTGTPQQPANPAAPPKGTQQPQQPDNPQVPAKGDQQPATPNVPGKGTQQEPVNPQVPTKGGQQSANPAVPPNGSAQQPSTGGTMNPGLPRVSATTGQHQHGAAAGKSQPGTSARGATGKAAPSSSNTHAAKATPSAAPRGQRDRLARTGAYALGGLLSALLVAGLGALALARRRNS